MSSQLEIRIYYEDTDHGGVVYHANYLKYMERGRTEYLRNLGFEQNDMAKQDDIVFALSRTDLRYIRPAHFDDLIRVETHLIALKGARLMFKQDIYRDEMLLVQGDMIVVSISQAGKPKRMPEDMKACLSKEIT